MTYQEFIARLSERFGEEEGVLMANRAEVGFLRKFIEDQNFPEFKDKQEKMFDDFLNRHQTN